MLKFGGKLQKSKDQGASLKGISDRKIDVVINMGGEQLPIYKIAREEGIQLI